MITGQIKRGGSLTGSVRQSGSLAPEIFWVTYGTTTAEEIVQAIAEQKVCVMSRDNSFYYLIRYTATEYFFASFDTTSEKIKYYRFYNNSWYYNTVTYQEALTFDTTPKQFSNNPVRSYGIWNAIQAAKTTVDATLSATSENPVQNRSVYEALATKADLSSVEPFVQDAVDEWMETYAPTIGTLSNAAKRALLNCFAHVAWIDNQGQTYYNALESELFPGATLESITAVFTQGSATIYDTDSLDTLKQYLVVTATYSDSTTATVSDYTLSGTLTAGTSTITASYGGKTDTFDVTVTARYELYDYLYNSKAASSDTQYEYVDTGLTHSPSFNTLNLEFEALNSNDKGGSDGLICANNTTTSDTGNIVWYSRVNKAGFSAYNLGVAKQLNTVPGDTRAIIKYFFVDGGESYMQWGNTTVAVATKSKSQIATNNKTLILAGGYQFSSGNKYGLLANAKTKLGYIKFTDPDTNTLLYHFIPAHDVEEDKWGFYEVVNGIFYPSNGTNYRCANWET